MSNRKKSPYGTTFLSRDNEQNRKLWGPDGVGTIDVAASICAKSDNNDQDAEQCPFYRYKEDASRQSASQTPIHLLIASFRDRLCPRTLHNAFTRAENPHRIYVRVIVQSLPNSDIQDDADCWERYCKDYNENCMEFRDNVRTVHQDARTAQGPTDARSKLSAMVLWDFVHRNEPDLRDFHPVDAHDFCMQTDSHMDFSDNFDTELVLMHHRAQNDYAVLSTYVDDMEHNNKNPPDVPSLCMVEFTSTIRNWGTKFCTNLVTPKLTNAMWGAGLSFHRCHAEINVPVDAYLDGVFDGEEGSRGIRFFTHGYDVYTPDRVLVTHDYKGHQSNPVVHTWKRHERHDGDEPKWKFMEAIEQERDKVRTVGTKRVNMMLGIGHDHYNDEDLQEITRIRRSRFGLGTRRTLEQAGEFTGIDLRNRKMVKNRCGNLIWVPFEDYPEGDYGVADLLQRGLTGETNSDLSGESGRMAKSSKDAAVLGSGDAHMAKISNDAVLRGNGPLLRARPIVKPTAHQVEATSSVVRVGIFLLIVIVAARYAGKRRTKGDRHMN